MNATVKTRYPDDSDHKDPNYLKKKYWIDGWSLHDIADDVGVGVGSVQYQFEKHDIPTRTSNKDKPCCVYTNKDGHEVAVSCSLKVGIHRLCAVAWFGWDKVVSNEEVHHHSEVPWDNREENLLPTTKSNHTRIHNTGGSFNDN